MRVGVIRGGLKERFTSDMLMNVNTQMGGNLDQFTYDGPPSQSSSPPHHALHQFAFLQEVVGTTDHAYELSLIHI